MTPKPFGIAIDGSGQYAYVADYSNNQAIMQFSIGATGGLTYMSTASGAGPNPVYPVIATIWH